MMKLTKLFLAVVMILVATLAWAVKGPQDVTNGVHNLSTTGIDPYFGTSGSSLYATNVEEVCVFCHTPHGGRLVAPLWNRNDPTPVGGWNHYNSASMSLHIQTLATDRVPNAESLLCLSCHDGSISVNHLINVPNSLHGATIQTTFSGDPDTTIIDDIITGSPGKRIGGGPIAGSGGTGDLSDDHPISFSYDSVLAGSDYTVGAKVGSLKDASTAESNGVRFFGAGNNVECSSCHDPHVNYLSSGGGNPAYAPFLIMPNTGSALCLACHTK